jgi:hypothetical protein
MKVYELIGLLLKLPAGARVFVSTQKDLDELLEDNLSKDENVADISFLVKNVSAKNEEIHLNF